MRHLHNGPDTLAYHQAHPDIPFMAHVRACELALARHILAKTRIYLDQKYWLYCRDANLGRPAKPMHRDILDALRRLVDSGKAICPVAHPVLQETLRQMDTYTRLATARVIDELSGRVVIKPYTSLEELELLHFMRSKTQAPDTIHAAEELAWTYPAWVLGLAVPHTPAFDKVANLALQKAFFDTIIHFPFSDLIESLHKDRSPNFAFDTAEAQRARTAETRQHRHEFRTFEDVFLIEVAGGLDERKELLEGAMIHLYENHIGVSPTPDEVMAGRAARTNLADLIHSAFKLDKIGTALPGIRILSGIHAAIRYRNDPHVKGDMLDHLHARTALPYCSMFLTEKKLGNLLTQRPLEYDKLYSCRVLWEDEKILAALRELE